MDRPRLRRPIASFRALAAFLACAAAAFAAGRSSGGADGEARAAPPRAGGSSDAPAAQVPRFDEAGRLLRPPRPLEWVLVGSSVGLGYAERERHGPAPGFFHQVYLDPSAFRHFSEEKTFPEGTSLALVVRTPEAGGAPVAAGHVAGDLAALEIAVKDARRFEGGWGYFDFTGPAGTLRERATAFPRAACAACHARHGARDNVFLQFYPVLREGGPTAGRPAAPTDLPRRRR